MADYEVQPRDGSITIVNTGHSVPPFDAECRRGFFAPQ
jgi:hypothetical protein